MKDPKKPENSESWWQPGLILFGRLSGWIVGPIILAIILGKWLDKKYGTEPWLFLVTIGVSFILSMFGIVKEGMQAIKEAGKDKKE